MGDTIEVRVGSQGRIVLPRELREQLGAEEGSVYVARVEDGERLVLESRGAVLQQMREELRSATSGRSLAEELIRERRDEVTSGDA